MSKSKNEIKSIADLPHYKEEFGAVLKEMGIETPEDLLDALHDEEQFKDIVDKLKGIGPKYAEHWTELLEESLSPEEETEIVEETPAVEEKKAKKLPKEKKKGEEAATEIVEYPAEAEVIPEGAYVAKIKPELDARTRDLLAKRAAIDDRRPAFLRQEWFRFSRLGEVWRKPKGIHSKMRRHYGYRPPIVSIGYGSPKEVRGYHPSGFQEVMVHNPAQLEKINPKIQAARVGGTVGFKKRLAIEKRADELGIRVLNRTG
ncbi:MAG: 50S ribosomal protein L32e [Methanomassiliicoccales archaeon]|nr:50S ribosomal protein L32e [Methanomassiliicoccales archaeon]